MTHKSGNPTWQNEPVETTPVSAAALENIEGAVDAALTGSADLTWDATGKVLTVNGNIVTTLPNGGDPLDASTNSDEFSRFQLSNADAGTNAASGSLFINDTGDVLQFYQGSSGNSATPHGVLFRSTGAGGFTVCADTGPIAFGSGAAAGSGEHMRITNAGKVGIGTATPADALDVVGNVSATGTVGGANLSGTNTGDAPAFRYIGSTAPVTTSWAVNDFWYDTSTEA